MNTNVLEYSVKKTDDGFEARMPYRQIVYCADTEQGAIGSMLRGVAELSFCGRLDPDAPDRKGTPVIQHTMRILERELACQIEARRSDVDGVVGVECGVVGDTMKPGRELLGSPDFNRRNEIISGIATAIAALARVKEL